MSFCLCACGIFFVILFEDVCVCFKEQTAGCRYNWSSGSDSLLSPSELSPGFSLAGLDLKQVAHRADVLKKLLLLNDTEGFSV